MNPAAPPLERAKRAYEEFHWGVRPNRVVRARVPAKPRALVKLGVLEEVVYSTTKGGDGFSHYHHKFERKRPVLAMDVDNQRLHVLGGSYTVTRRGIEG